MRKYETFFIIDPDISEDEVSNLNEKFQNVIGAQGGTVINYVSWGKKRLAYPVRKRSRGHYILTEYAGGPDLVMELERTMRLDERVLKFITVKLDDRFDPQKELPSEAAGETLLDEEDLPVGLSESAEEEELTASLEEPEQQEAQEVVATENQEK